MTTPPAQAWGFWNDTGLWSQSHNIVRSIQIAVDDQKAARAMIGSLTQGHGLPMATPATILRRVGRVDFDELSASFCRFARELRKELRPRRITDTFCQTMIVKHPFDVQIFHTDDAEMVHDLPTVLVSEVAAPPPGSFMRLESELDLVAVRERAKSLPRPRSSPESFVLSIPDQRWARGETIWEVVGGESK